MEQKEQEDISFISSKMKPFVEKRLGVPGAEELCWISEGSLYKYKEDFGCYKLKRLDIDAVFLFFFFQTDAEHGILEVGEENLQFF